MRKRPVYFVAAFALMGVFVYLLSRSPADQISLRVRSRHLASLTGKISPLGYQWHPDGSVICERPGSKGVSEVYRTNPESGTEKLLYRFTRSGTGYGFDDAGLLSPDGRWRISTTLKWCIVASLDGTRSVTVTNNTNRMPMQSNGPYYERTVAWQPDSRHWVELANENGQNVLLVRALDSSKPRRVLMGAVSREQSLLGVTPENCAIVAVNWGRQVFTVPLNGKGGSPTSKFVGPPRGILPYSAALSPDARQLVWSASEVETGNLHDVVLGIYNHIRGKEPRTRSLWISRVDGTGWRLLGKDPRTGDELKDIRFTPDGKRVSYIFGSEFYTIPVP